MSAPKDLPQCIKTPPPPPGPKQYDLYPKVTSAIGRIQSWTEDERYQLTCELIKGFGCDHGRSKKLMNLARDLMAKAKKSHDQPTDNEVCGQQRNVDPGASEVAVAAPATKVPFLCRGDILVNTKLLFFDTEKVTISQSHENKSGDLAIVDIKGRLLFWCYIHQENVCKFNTNISGLDKSKMEMGVSVETVKDLLQKLLTGKEIWGAKSSDDAKSLGFGSGFFPNSSTNDIQTFYRDFKKDPIRLGLLAEHFLGEDVQGKTHSSITDARITALCYRKMMELKALGMTRFNCPVMDEIRKNPAKKESIKYDSCTCGKVSSTKKGKKRGVKNATMMFSSSVHNFDLDDFVM